MNNQVIDDDVLVSWHELVSRAHKCNLDMHKKKLGGEGKIISLCDFLLAFLYLFLSLILTWYQSSCILT